MNPRRLLPSSTVCSFFLIVVLTSSCGKGGDGGPTVPPPPPPPAPVATVEVSPATATVVVGGTQQLTAVTKDAAGNTLTGRTVTWTASDAAVATVSNTGLVTAAAYTGGSNRTATLTATSEGRSATATITVTPTPVATVEVTPGSATVSIGGTQQLTAVTKDAAGTALTGRTVTWTTSAVGVATVSSTGLVTAVAAGSVTITATSETKAATAAITVTVPVATVAVSPATVTVFVGGTQQMTAVTKDAAGNTLAGRTVVWTTSAAGVATVSSTGLVTAVAVGAATITATSEGKTATAAINVVVPVATVEVSPAAATVVVGATQQLTAVTKDAAGNTLTGRTVTWTTSDTAVATVSSTGLVTAAAYTGGGTSRAATLTATSEGRSATATITVTLTPVATVSVTPGTATVSIGETWQLSAVTKNAAGATQKGRTVTWTTSDAGKATVSALGLVTGVAAGSVTITATSEGKAASAAITVRTVQECLRAGATTVSVPQTVNGALATTDCTTGGYFYTDLYKVTLSAAQTVRFRLTSTAFDAFLELYDTNGDWIADDDDSGGGTTAELTKTLVAGTYYIGAASNLELETGAYTLTLASAGGGVCTLAGAATVAVPQTVNGALATTDCTTSWDAYADLYRVTVGAAGQTVRFRMTSAAFDTYLELYDANGEFIDWDDDGAGGTNSDLSWTVEAGTTYYLYASSYEGGGLLTGAYTLTSESVGSGECTLAGATTVSLPQTVNGTLATTDCTQWAWAYGDLYKVTMAAGQKVRARMTGAAIGPNLLLYDANYQPVEYDDYETTAELNFTSLVAATYYLAASSDNRWALGAYTLTIESVATGECTGALATTASVPQTVSGGLATADCKLGNYYSDLFKVTVGAEQHLRIRMSGTAFDPYLALYDANGHLLAEDDDDGGGTTAELTRRLKAGTYYIAATSYEQLATGAYTLTIVSVGSGVCALAGAATVSVPQTVNAALTTTDCTTIWDTYGDMYKVTLGTGQTVRFRMTSTAVDPSIQLYDANGVWMDWDDDGGGGTTAELTQTLAAGTYYVRAESYHSWDTGAYTLAISAVSGEDLVDETPQITLSGYTGALRLRVGVSGSHSNSAPGIAVSPSVTSGGGAVTWDPAVAVDDAGEGLVRSWTVGSAPIWADSLTILGPGPPYPIQKEWLTRLD